MLEPGATHVSTSIVDESMSPPHLAPVIVLATPEMIWLMEEACTSAVQPSLEEGGRTTVGTHIDVSHESAARMGEEVLVEAALVAVDGPRLTFEVEARVGDRIIGRGTHRRHVIDRSRFAEPAAGTESPRAR
jgi:fluoroacetyl-CoA thioesterase